MRGCSHNAVSSTAAGGQRTPSAELLVGTWREHRGRSKCSAYALLQRKKALQ